jgi:catalase
MEVSVLELNRNPENYHADIEQAAFAPAHIVPSISFSPDKVLQARLLSNPKAHRYRLGVNAESLPVNRPHATEAHTYHRDGAMRFDANGGGSVNYESDSFGAPVDDAHFKEPPLSISGEADRYDHRLGNADYTQAGNLYRLLPADEQHRLFRNIAAAMQGVPQLIIERQLKHFVKADPDYGARVAKAFGLPIDKPKGVA